MSRRCVESVKKMPMGDLSCLLVSLVISDVCVSWQCVSCRLMPSSYSPGITVH